MIALSPAEAEAVSALLSEHCPDWHEDRDEFLAAALSGISHWPLFVRVESPLFLSRQSFVHTAELYDQGGQLALRFLQRSAASGWLEEELNEKLVALCGPRTSAPLGNRSRPSAIAERAH